MILHVTESQRRYPIAVVPHLWTHPNQLSAATRDYLFALLDIISDRGYVTHDTMIEAAHPANADELLAQLAAAGYLFAGQHTVPQVTAAAA